MTIVIVPSQPIGSYGPGLGITLSSATNPIPVGFQWLLDFRPITDTTAQGWVELFQATSNPQTVMLGASGSLQGQGTFSHQFKGDDQVQLIAHLQPVSGSSVENGTFTARWEPTQGLGYLMPQLQLSSAGQGGFTDTDRQNLTDVTTATALPISLDTFTTSSLPIDPSTGFGAAQLPTGIWGVIVRLTQIADVFPPITPDDDYRAATLCVVRIFRGSDLWLRVPIHTTSRLISIWDQSVVTAVTQATATQWLLNMSIQAQFKPGCLGDVLFMHFP